eukprot:gene1538-4320_t
MCSSSIAAGDSWLGNGMPLHVHRGVLLAGKGIQLVDNRAG